MSKRTKNDHSVPTAVCAAAAIDAIHPATPVSLPPAPHILDAQRLFVEAQRQASTPLVSSADGAGVEKTAKLLQQMTARPRGLSPEVARTMAVRTRTLKSLIAGPHPTGKAAEVVAAADYAAIHRGSGGHGMANSPTHVPANVQDVRLSPDDCSKRDLLFKVRTGPKSSKFVPGGQVKTGQTKYVAPSLEEMGSRPNYGKLGLVDAALVDPAGEPRVGSDAFSPTEAKKITDAEVELRGIRDLHKRARRLVRDILRHERDGLDPETRQRLLQMRDDIARAYRAKGIAGRAAGGAAIAAATAAVVSLIVQYAATGKIDLGVMKDATGKAALMGGAGAIVDAGLYHLAANAGMAPEAAKSLAQQGASAGFCLLAVGADLFAEIKAARDGHVSVGGAIAGSAAKTALDLLPYVLAPLGWAGVPVLIGAQLGGRWVIAHTREVDSQIARDIEADLAVVMKMQSRIDSMDVVIGDIRSECADTDAIFAKVMGAGSLPHSLAK